MGHMEDMKEKLYSDIKEIYGKSKIFMFWVLLSCMIGMIVGIVGGMFHLALEYVTDFRIKNPDILWALPLAGLGIIFFYKFMGMELLIVE